ncbi:MAG: FAD-dependent oxidoreductase [Gemmatimonadetes bacterium]|nr:FAD-dependent oxidoreductase [Gemmatimonadota bacterium]MYG85969.1 FAD-dependent oxidoreductase [Gemmatimonadota bacterium]MYJ90047.1 FAD-dependent oxidoreductase [Gemmatimonadota bacterium]
MNANKKKTMLSRRNFLARGGGVLVPIVLSTACSDNAMGPNVSDPPTSPRTIPPQSDPWPTDPWQPDWQPEPKQPEDRVDVIVVGAGLSGLVAAYELVRAGHDVRVLEASNAIGGRAQTLRDPFDDGLIAETGPARIPPSHDLTLGYIDHFGIETSPFYTQEGEYLILSREEVRRRLKPDEFLRGRETWLKIPAGTDALPMAFADELGDRVQTGSPVTKVVRDENGVVATFGNGGEELKGSHLICTVPLPVIDKIEFVPALSAPKLAAFEALSYQDVTRVYVQYAQRIWEEDDLNGWGLSYLAGYQEIWHPTWNQEGPRGILMSYMFGGMARGIAAMDPGAIVPDFIGRYEGLFPGTREVAEHGTYFAWEHQPWIGAAFASYNPPFSENPELASPEGPIHFAGEHASGNRGWMQGAFESGLRAASEIDDSVTWERRASARVAISRRQMMSRLVGTPSVPAWLVP